MRENEEKDGREPKDPLSEVERLLRSLDRPGDYCAGGRMFAHMPLVDNNAIDAATRRGDGSSIEVQIKTRSKRRRPVCDDRSQAAGRLV